MRKQTIAAIVAAAGLAMLPAAAQAADPVTFPANQTSTGQTVPLHQTAPFNWNRFYAGIYGTAQKGGPGWQYGAGLEAGVNSQVDFYLLGAEVAVSGLTNSGSNDAYGQILARGGVLLTDDLVAYGATGYGINLSNGSDQNLLVGGGLEMAVADNVSLKGQYLYGIPLTSTSPQVNQITVGANFHF